MYPAAARLTGLLFGTDVCFLVAASVVCDETSSLRPAGPGGEVLGYLAAAAMMLWRMDCMS